MRILLECQNCYKVSDKLYKSVFKPVNADLLVTMEMDCSCVVGSEYELLLKGSYPSYNEGRPCVGNMLSFKIEGGWQQLTSVDWLKRETEKLDKLS